MTTSFTEKPVSRKSDTIEIKLGSGKNYSVNGMSGGNDTLIFSYEEGKDKGTFQYEQAIDGNSKPTKDLKITYTKGDTTKDTILIKDYFTSDKGDATKSSVKTVQFLDGEKVTSTALTDLISYTFKFGETVPQTVKGTVFNDKIDVSSYNKTAGTIGKGVTINAGAGSDTITGSKHNDVIKTVSGTNTITAGAGNDKLYAGTGEDTFNFAQGSGDDTLYASKAKDSQSKLSFESDQTLAYTKNGNDVVITATKGGTTDTVTVKDFLKKEGAYDVTVKGDDLAGKKLEVSGKGTINGSFMNDNITGSDAIAINRADKGKNEFEHNGYIYTKNETEGNKVTAGSVLDANHVLVENKVYNITGLNGVEEKDKVAEQVYTKIGEKYYLNSDLEGKSSTYVPPKKAGEGQFEHNGYIYSINETNKVVKKAWSGNDVIKAGKGTDYIIGGTGNDKLYGGEGTNTYEFKAGDGKDTVYVTKGATDILKFDTNQKLSYDVKGNDVVITATKGEGDTAVVDTVTVKDYMKGGYNVSVLLGETPKGTLQSILSTEGGKIVNLQPNKNKGVTYKGTILDEKITGTKFNDKIYAGAGKDTIDAGAGKNYISGGIGENTINIDINDQANNTVELTKGEKLTININNGDHNIWGNYKTSVVGKDLVIGFYTNGADRFDTSKSADLGTLTIKNFANNNGGAEKLLITSKGFEFDLIRQQYRTGKESSWSQWTDIPTVMYDSTVNNSFMKSGKLTGSNLNEVFDASNYRKDAPKIGKGVTINAGAGSDTITGSKHNDVIKTVSGTNTITAGAGNDKLYAGTGEDTFNFAKGHGADTLYASKAEDAKSKLMFTGSPAKLTYTKVGNDIKITAEGYDDTDSVLVKDFLKKEGAYTVKIGESELLLENQQLLVSGKGTIKGSFMDDKITGSDKADKIYAYGGTNEITAKKGNDTIYVNTKDSTNTINIANGDGNDTVYTSKDSVTTLKYDTGDTLSYASKGKDLVITRSYTVGSSETPTTETTTIKDYFAQAGVGKLYTQIGDDGRKDVYNESITYTDSSKSDVIELGNGNNTFNYTKGDDEYTSGTGSDTYNVKYTSSADLLITDKGGSDTLKITNTTKDDLALLFNVNKSGQIIVTTDEDGDDSLGIFSKTATYSAKKGLSGGIIEIDGFFKATPGSDPTVIPGDGYIETIKVGDGASPESWTVTIDSLKSIAQDVAGWLADHKDYADANAVFSSENTSDIQSLLTAYQGTYTPKVSGAEGAGA